MGPLASREALYEMCVNNCSQGKFEYCVMLLDYVVVLD